MAQDLTPIPQNNESFVSYLSKLYTVILTISFVCALAWLFSWANDVYDYMPSRMFWPLCIGIFFGIILGAGFFYTIISIRKNLELMNDNFQKFYISLRENNNNPSEK